MPTRRQRSASTRNSSGKLGRLMLAGPLVGLMSVPALAGPQGEQVVSGTAQFTRNGNNTIIRVSNTAIINYSSFNLTADEAVRFIQAGVNPRVLNRITSGMPTFIDGSVSANGSVYFINNAGIVFGQHSVINAGSFYAAAGNISNRDFLAGRDHFTNVTGEVVNHGRIEAGEVGLVGRRVANYGSIVAPQGMVTFAAGDDVFIGERGSHVFAQVSARSQAAENAGIEQAGSIDAQSVNLSVGDTFALAVLDSSSIRASQVRIQGGDHDSTVRVAGDIDVSRAQGHGGRVEVFGQQILLDGAHIDASGGLGGGVIRIGGDFQGRGSSPTSDYVLVTDGSLLNADALQSGRGGRVIVWSDTFTGFGGYISARGGALNGDGGFVEVSGKGALAYRGLSDVRAPQGLSGSLLLDPQYIHIVDGPTGSWPSDAADGLLDFSEAIETITLTDADLENQLNLLGPGGQLTLQASTDIRMFDQASVHSTGEGLLILEAGRSVHFEGNSALDLGTGSLRVIANSDGYVPGAYARADGLADIAMSAGSSIITDGGTVELLLQNYGESDNILVSTIDAGAGTVHIEHTGLQGASSHHIAQVAGGDGISAGTVELISSSGGSVGPNDASRLLVSAEALTVNTDGGDAFLSLTSPTVVRNGRGAVAGIATNGGDVDLVSASSLELQGDINAGAGDVRLDVANLSSTGGSILGADVNLTADSFDLLGGGVHGDTGVTINGRNDLLADNDLLDHIDATGMLTLRSLSGDIAVTAPSAAFSTASDVLLDANQRLTFGGADGAAYQFTSLTANAGNGISFSAGVTSLSATGGIALDAGAGSVNFLSPAGFDLSAGATMLHSDVVAAGGLHVVGGVDATGGLGQLDLSIGGTLMLDEGLDASGRDVNITADGVSLGGLLTGLNIVIFNDEFSVGNDNGGFWVSNQFLDLTNADVLTLSPGGNPASQVWLDGISTTFDGRLIANAGTISAINNNSAIHALELNAQDQLLIDGVRLEVTGAGQDLRLAAINGIHAADGAELAASGVSSRVVLVNDVFGSGNLTFDGNVLIDGAGTRSIVLDGDAAGTLRFNFDINAAAGQGLLADAGTGTISFGSGVIGQGGAFGSIDLAAAGGLFADTSIALVSNGGITIRDALTAGGRINAIIDADGTADGSDVGSFMALASKEGFGPAGIMITNGAADAGNIGLLFNGLVSTSGVGDEGIFLNAGSGNIGLLGGVTSAGGDVSTRAATTVLAGDVASNGGFVAFAGDVSILGNHMVASGGGEISFNGNIAGSIANADELHLDAAGGDVLFGGDVGGANNYLAKLEVIGAQHLTFGGSSYQAFATSLNADEFSVDHAGGGTVEFISRGGDLELLGGPMRLALGNDLDIQATEGGDVRITDVFADAADGDARVTARVNDRISFAGLGESGRWLSLVDVQSGADGAEGLASFNGAGFSDTWAIDADEVDLLGGFASISGHHMTITQHTDGRGINIGGDGSDTARLNLTLDDMDALADGFEDIRIGSDTTKDVNFIAAEGDLPLTLRDPLEVRAQTLVAVMNEIVGENNASLSLFADGNVILGSDITLVDGDLSAHNLAGASVDVLIEGDVHLATDGSVSLAGSIDGGSPTEDSLDISADGDVTLGVVGTSQALQNLHIVAGDISIEGIGTDTKAGVKGMTELESNGGLTFLGGLFNANEARYSAADKMTANVDLRFITNSHDIFFGLDGTAGHGGIVFVPGARSWSVDAGTAAISLDGNYAAADRLDVSLTGSRIMLAGDTTLTSTRGAIDFDGLLLGHHDLTMNTGASTIQFLQNIGVDGNVESVALGDMDISAARINFMGTRIEADSARFAATRYAFEPNAALPETTFRMHDGDLAFDGGIILFQRGALHLNTDDGSINLAQIRGGADARNLTINGHGLVVINGIGTSNSSGVDNLYLIGDDLDVRGDVYVRGQTLLRPSSDGRAIDIGAALNLTNARLEVTQSLLDHFVSTLPQSTLSIGGFSTADDFASLLNNSADVFSDSAIRIFDVDFTRQTSIFGNSITLVSGNTLNVGSNAPLRLSAQGALHLDGMLISNGSAVGITGAGTGKDSLTSRAFLSTNINMNGGDLEFRRVRTFIDGDVQVLTNGGDFHVFDGGIDGITEGSGNLMVDVGAGRILLGSDVGFGQRHRLASLQLTARQLHIRDVATTGDQTYLGTSLLQLDGGVLESQGGTIHFLNNVMVAGEATANAGIGGRVLVDHDILGANHTLTLGAFGNNPDAFNGIVEFRGDARGVGGLHVRADALMYGDRMFRGGSVEFFGRTNAADPGASLLVDADSTARFGRSVGGMGRFSTIDVSGDRIFLGTAGQDMRIDTSGLQLYTGDAVVSGRNVTLQTHGYARSDSIIFQGDIDGQFAGANTLTLIVDRTHGRMDEHATMPPTDVPVIGFNGSIGTTTRLGGLNLNTDGSQIDGRVDADGRSFASSVATIVFGDVDAFISGGFTSLGDYFINADRLRMGHGEAITSLGSLTARGVDARIGDISAVGNLRLEFSDSIGVMSRGRARVFDPISGASNLDDGTDLVAAGGDGIRISTAHFEVLPDANQTKDLVYLSALGGRVSLVAADTAIRALPAGSQNQFVFQSPGVVANAATLSTAGIVLDPRSAGPTNTNVAEAIAGAVQDANSGNVESGTVVEATVRDVLSDLGLQPRGYPLDYAAADKPEAEQAATEVMLASLDGVGTYVDIADIDNDGIKETTVERLNRDVTIDVVKRYQSLWFVPRDDQGNPLPPQAEPGEHSLIGYPISKEYNQVVAIVGAFNQVTTDCRRAHPETADMREIPADIWVPYLQENAARYPRAMRYMQELEELMTGLRRMGLGPDELLRIWATRLEQIVPPGVDGESFREIVSGNRPVRIATDSSNNGKEPVIDMQ